MISFDPRTNYMVLTHRLVADVRSLTGLGHLTHDSVRSVFVPAMTGAGSWKRVKCDRGDGYVVSLTAFGVPMSVRVVFATTPDGRRTVAPDGRKTMVYVTHAYPRKEPSAAR